MGLEISLITYNLAFYSEYTFRVARDHLADPTQFYQKEPFGPLVCIHVLELECVFMYFEKRTSGMICDFHLKP